MCEGHIMLNYLFFLILTTGTILKTSSFPTSDSITLSTRSSSGTGHYDPFFYYFYKSKPQFEIETSLPSLRTRRNSKFTQNLDLYADEHNKLLLNEDVHFFRMDKGQSTSNRQEPEALTSRLMQIPILYPEHPRPLTVERLPSSSVYPHHGSRIPSRINTFEGRHYQSALGTNKLDYNYGSYYEHPTNVDRPEHGFPGEPIDGWSVQVGTQLHVHDDGRSRNPSQHYVRDEKPNEIRRYPISHHRNPHGPYSTGRRHYNY